MQTELPTMLNVFQADYHLEYSDSYSGTVHRETIIEGYQYCTSLQIAFESLISDRYTNFILTVGLIGAAIYCNGNMGFKIFGSHARDLYGRGHPQGTCVPLEIPSLISLVHYFQGIHNNEIFEIKVVHINQVQNSTLSQTNTFGTQDFNLSCAVAIYSLCYSIIKSCSYWNSNTLAVIVDNGKRLCDNLSLNGNFSPADLPRAVEIFGAEVILEVSSDSSEVVLSDSLQSKLMLHNIIVNNSECTGLLMWFSCYYIRKKRIQSICIVSWLMMKIM